MTGGSGFAGRFIVERLLSAGHGVAVWGRRHPAPAFSQPVEFVEGELDPGGDFQRALNGIDFLVHAAFDHVPGRYRGGEGRDPEGFRRRNVDGSLALFKAAPAAGVRRAVFLSSRAVYGAQAPGVVLTEGTEPRPDTLYGSVKREVEHAITALRTADFDAISLRVTGIYGQAGAGEAHKWTDLFADFLSGRPIEPRVATEVHGGDVAEAVRLMLESPAPPQDVYNVSDLVLDRHDLLGLVQSVAGTSHALPPRADASVLNAMEKSRLQGLGWRPGGWPLLERTVGGMLAKME